MNAARPCLVLFAGGVLALFAWHVRPVAAEPAATEPLGVSNDAPVPTALQRGQQPPGARRVYKESIAPHWFANETKMWYRNDLRGGAKEFILVDAMNGTRETAFDHAKVAAGLSTATGKEYRGDRLPFDSIAFPDDLKSVRFEVGKDTWTCDLSTFKCTKGGAKPEQEAAQVLASNVEPLPWPEAPSIDPHLPPEATAAAQPPNRQVRSPDKKHVAFIQDYNILLGDADGNETVLTKDGRDGFAYGSLSWSPDSQFLVAFRTEPGEQKTVTFVESSPKGGGRAVSHTRPYALPGDKFTSHELHLFDAAKAREIKVEVDRIDFGTPRPRWKPDGHTFTYEKVDRGHQRFRLVEVDAASGTTRNLIDEQLKTFIWTTHFENVNLPPVTYLKTGGEIIYATERSGWRHLELVDVKTGKVKNAITSGEYVVRGIVRIDEETRQVWFRASGKVSGQDPYLMHFYRVNFDGTGLVALTEGNGTHSVQFSPERKFLVDSYSRVDAAPVHELRRDSDGKLVCKLETADIADLKAAGWEAPEVFTAKGRDGTTDIWGIIARPRNFDPKKKYPIIEYIYAGPHGSFVPKAFSPFARFQTLTELGFVVVQCDGMGTANRSKAFHDVCWHDIKDSGFPDRILWHKAIAEKYPWYDISRVGIYGTSAGGQSTLAGLLHHGDFYKAGMAACGCHDNRLDKASWNEQWMGYPVGPHYAANSNVDNAHKLTGKLLLIVGEMDTNVPPESTFRVVDALVRANKDFELLVVPGMGHSDGGTYGRRRMQDFFVRHLQGVEPPDRNAAPRGEPKKKAIEEVSFDQPEKLPVAPPPRLKVPPPDVAGMIRKPANEALAVSRMYDIDRAALVRTYFVPYSPARTERLRKFDSDWITKLKATDFATLSPAAREELLTLRTRVEDNLKDVNRRAAEVDAVAPLIPFEGTIVELEEARRRVESVDAVKVAGRVDGLRKEVERLRKTVEAASKSGSGPTELGLSPWSATRAADATDSLRASLKTWHGFYTGYDPEFTWWVAEPYRLADVALGDYAKSLRNAAKALPATDRVPSPRLIVSPYPGPSDVPELRQLLATPRSEFAAVIEQYGRSRTDPSRWLLGMKGVKFDELSPPAQVDYLLLKNHLERESKRQELRTSTANRPPVPKDDTGITGRPIGRDALVAELTGEMIPYSPEELIAIARKELAWCDAEMLKASREMGHGDDWRTALEKVKQKHLKPGDQPRLIRDLSDEAVAYLKKHDLVTVPPLAEETWRMIMMTPERQLVSPFFTGGEVISVAFPTNTMSHEAKLQSLRGNNIHFSRATVQHELIPGHHLQQYMNARNNTQRGMFGTPFWTEGWALYWELVLYEKGFPKTPEDRIGFLTWRKHRCARIIFSLSYHMGLMTPRECIDLLTDRVGFEPENAAAEVRRSFGGGYGPLYQAAYLLGGFQFWELRKELVGTAKMTDKQFHDAILREHAMPVAMVRAVLTDQPLTAEGLPPWRFGDE